MASKTVKGMPEPPDSRFDGRSRQAALQKAVNRVLNEKTPESEKRLVRILRGLAMKAEEGDVGAARELLDRAFGKQPSQREITYEGSVKLGPDAEYAKILERLSETSKLSPPTIDVTPDDKG